MTPDGDGLRAACGHAGPATPPALCEHLREKRRDPPSCYRCYTGVGLDYLLLCRACAVRFEAERPPAALVCADCLEAFTGDLGDAFGSRGRPEVRERPGGPEVVVPTTFPLGASLPAPLIDLAHADARRQWFGLCADGTIVSVGLRWQSVTVLATVTLQAEPVAERPPNRPPRRRLHVAPSGRFAAVVNDYGRYGVVVDLATGRVTMDLDGGDYYPSTVPFSLTFASHRERDVVVHRTEGNRLDVSDPGSARLLTPRAPTSHRRGDPRPAHYLDYCHGAIQLSPDGRRLVDDGWVWHPWGIPTAWDLQDWLDGNAWESEDGPSRRRLDARAYYWDHGMCWIDSNHVALEGIGTDADHMVAGARIFDVTRSGEAPSILPPSAEETTAFAGPSGDFFSDGRRLFTSADDGLSIWDPAAGERTARAPGFRPRYYARSSSELVEIGEGEVSIWSTG